EVPRDEAREARSYARLLPVREAPPPGHEARSPGRLGGRRVNRDIDESSENVIAEWSKQAPESSPDSTDDAPAALELEQISAEAADEVDEPEHTPDDEP